MQFNSIQFNSIQFNSMQFNSIQFNSIQKSLSQALPYRNSITGAPVQFTCTKVEVLQSLYNKLQNIYRSAPKLLYIFFIKNIYGLHSTAHQVPRDAFHICHKQLSRACTTKWLCPDTSWLTVSIGNEEHSKMHHSYWLELIVFWRSGKQPLNAWTDWIDLAEEMTVLDHPLQNFRIASGFRRTVSSDAVFLAMTPCLTINKTELALQTILKINPTLLSCLRNPRFFKRIQRSHVNIRYRFRINIHSECEYSLHTNIHLMWIFTSCEYSPHANIHLMRIFTSCEYSPHANIHLMRIFTSCEYSPHANIRLMRIFTSCEYSPHANIHLMRIFTNPAESNRSVFFLPTSEVIDSSTPFRHFSSEIAIFQWAFGLIILNFNPA